MWRNGVQTEWPQMTTWRMRISRCVPKATHTHSQYVIITVIPLQKRLPERPSMLPYTYIARHVNLKQVLLMIHRQTKWVGKRE